MAITILTQPQLFTTLNLALFKVVSSRPTIQQFKVEVLDAATNTVIAVQKYATLPMINLGTSFNLAPLLSSFVTYQIETSTDIIKQVPKIYKSYKIRITEIYLVGTTQTNGDVLTSGLYNIFNATLSRPDFSAYNYLNYVTNNTGVGSYFLSKRPQVSNLYRSSIEYLYFLAGIDTYARIKFYKKGGVEIGSHIVRANLQGKNLFDKTAVVNGEYVDYGTGNPSVNPALNISRSDYIGVMGLENITVSGLVVQPLTNAYRFTDAVNNTLAFGAITNSTQTIAVPPGAVWFTFNTQFDAPDLSYYNVMQVESGTAATAYAPYKKETSKAFRLNLTPSALSAAFGDELSNEYGGEFGDMFDLPFGTLLTILDANYFTVELLNYVGTVVSEKRTYILNADKCRVITLEALFLNNLGGFDSMIFVEPRQTVNSAKTTIDANPFQYTTGGDYVDKSGGLFNPDKIVIGSKNISSFSTISEPLNDANSLYGRSIIESDFVLMKLNSGDLLPVILDSQDYSINKIKYNTNNYRLTATFKVADTNFNL